MLYGRQEHHSPLPPATDMYVYTNICEVTIQGTLYSICHSKKPDVTVGKNTHITDNESQN